MDKMLTLTALTDLWDSKKETVFLGPWCIREFYNKAIYENMEYEVYQFPKDKLDYELLIEYYNKLCEVFVPEISRILNEYHGVNKSNLYWKKILGAWLFDYFELWYRLYYTLENALCKYPGIEINTYKFDKDFTFVNVMELKDWNIPEEERYDFYYQICFNRILKFMQRQKICEFNLNYRQYTREIKRIEVEKHKDKHKEIRDYIRNIANMLYFILSKNAKYVAVDLKVESVRKFKIGTLGKAYYMESPHVILKENRNSELRRKLFSKLEIDAQNDFERFLLENIMVDFPIELLEGYNEIKKDCRKYIKYLKPKLVRGEYGTNELGILCAEWAEKGTLISREAHSPAMSLHKAFWNHLNSQYDFFYVWGKSIYPRTLKAPTFKYIKENQCEGKERHKILWCSSGLEERYLSYVNAVLGAYTESEMNLLLEIQEHFARNLDDMIAKKIVYRPRDAQSFGLKQYVEKWNKSIKFDEGIKEVVAQGKGGALRKLLSESRIVIVNTWWTDVLFEALVRNIPTLIVGPDFTEMSYKYTTDFVKPLYRKLKEYGIWIENGKEASIFLNEHYYDIMNWWLEADRQKVIHEIVEAVYFHIEDSTKWWIDEVKYRIQEL